MQKQKKENHDRFAVFKAAAEKYTYRVIWSEEDGEFVGLVAEMPSLSWLEKEQGGALNGIVTLVGQVLAELHDDGETPPEPLSKKEYNGKIAVRIPPEQHRELAMEAAEQGVSMNRLISKKLSR